MSSIGSDGDSQDFIEEPVKTERQKDAEANKLIRSIETTVLKIPTKKNKSKRKIHHHENQITI